MILEAFISCYKCWIVCYTCYQYIYIYYSACYCVSLLGKGLCLCPAVTHKRGEESLSTSTIHKMAWSNVRPVPYKCIWVISYQYITMVCMKHSILIILFSIIQSVISIYFRKHFIIIIQSIDIPLLDTGLLPHSLKILTEKILNLLIMIYYYQKHH